MHIHFEDVLLEEVWVGLASDVQGRDGEGGIEFTVFNDKSPPFSEIFTLLELLSRHYVFSTIIDIFAERLHKFLQFFFRVIPTLNPIIFEQSHGLNLHLSKIAILRDDLAVRMVISGLPVCKLGKEVLRIHILQPFFVDVQEVDVHHCKFRIGWLEEVQLLCLV